MALPKAWPEEVGVLGERDVHTCVCRGFAVDPL